MIHRASAVCGVEPSLVAGARWPGSGGSVGVMKVLVSGASGSVGGAVFTRLRRAGVEVRGGSRHPEGAGLPEGTAVAFDLGDAATLGPALDGVEAVFLYAATGDLQPFLDAARAAGGPRVVLLSSASIVGAAGRSDGPIAAHHLALERAITAAELPATFVRGGYFATNSLRWAGEVRSTGSITLTHPLSRLAPVHEADLAEVAAAALVDDALVGAAPVVTGPARTTQREMVETIAAALGRSVDVVALSGQQAEEYAATQYPAPIAGSMQAFFAEQVDHPAALSDAVETITGHPGRTFATWVDDHLDAFR